MGVTYYNDERTPLNCDSCMLAIVPMDQDVYYTCSELCDYDICQKCAQCDRGHSLVRKMTETTGLCRKCDVVKPTQFECLGATCHDYAVCSDCLKLAN